MKLNSKRLYEKEKNNMQEQRKSRLGAYRERIFEIMDSLEEITDELDELQEVMEDDNEIQFPPLDENGEEIREDSVPPMNVTICVMPEGKNFTLPIEMIRRMLDEH